MYIISFHIHENGKIGNVSPFLQEEKNDLNKSQVTSLKLLNK